MDSIGCGRVIGETGFAQKGLFFLDCVHGLVHGVDAHDEHLVVLAGLERSLCKPGGEAMLHLRTEHRALVVDLGHHDWLVAEPTAEWAAAAGLVGEDRSHGKWLAKALLDAGMGEISGRLLRSHAERLVCLVALCVQRE